MCLGRPKEFLKNVVKKAFFLFFYSIHIPALGFGSVLLCKTEDMNDPNPTRTFRLTGRMGRFPFSPFLRSHNITLQPNALIEILLLGGFFDIKKEPTRHLTFVSGLLSSNIRLLACLMHVVFSKVKDAS